MMRGGLSRCGGPLIPAAESVRVRLRARRASPTGGSGSSIILKFEGVPRDVGDEEVTAGAAGEIAHERDVKSVAAPEKIEPEIHVSPVDQAFLCPSD